MDDGSTGLCGMRQERYARKQVIAMPAFPLVGTHMCSTWVQYKDLGPTWAPCGFAGREEGVLQRTTFEGSTVSKAALASKKWNRDTSPNQSTATKVSTRIIREIK